MVIDEAFKARELKNLKTAVRGIKRNNIPIQTARAVIEKAVEDLGTDLCLGWSGGYCSTAALHMALQVDPNIKVLFSNTGVEYHENLEYVEKLVDEWSLNFTELKPSKTFWEIVDKYGMPQIAVFGSSRVAKRATRAGKLKYRVPRCCFYLKDQPRFAYYKETGLKGQISGLRGAEGRNRAIVIGQRGQIYPLKYPINGFMSYHPIAFWGVQKLYAYLEKHKIPENEVYRTQDRNGCWSCTAYKGWQANVKRYSLKMYEFLSHKKGVMLMTDYIPDLTPCEAGLIEEKANEEEWVVETL